MTVAPHSADRTTRLALPATATRDLVLLVLLADTPIPAYASFTRILLRTAISH